MKVGASLTEEQLSSMYNQITQKKMTSNKELKIIQHEKNMLFLQPAPE
jgi:hypothetical protein